MALQLIDNQHTRLKEIREKLGYNQGSFAELMGIKQGSYSDIERGRNGVSPKVLEILANNYNININWLLTGQGSMFATEISIQPMPTNSEWNVTLLETRVSAGLLSNAMQIRELDGEKMYIPRLPKSEVPYIGLYVEGDSMSPEFNNGDLIVCKRLMDEREFRSDKVYVVVTNSDVLLKYVRKIQDVTDPNNGKLLLTSINEARFKPQYLYFGDDTLYQLYTLVAHCRYFT